MAISKAVKQRIRENKEKRNAWPYVIRGETSAWQRELKLFLNKERDKLRFIRVTKPHESFTGQFEDIAGLYTTVSRKQWYSVRHDLSTALFKLLNPPGTHPLDFGNMDYKPDTVLFVKATGYKLPE